MITSAFVYIFYFFLFVLTAPLRVLPDVSIDSGVVSAIAFAAEALASLAVFFPLTFAAFLGTTLGVIVIENYHFTYKGIMWVVNLIRGSG